MLLLIFEIDVMDTLWLLNRIQDLTKYSVSQGFLFNKLGQRQSQTPFSSAFWVQKDFG